MSNLLNLYRQNIGSNRRTLSRDNNKPIIDDTKFKRESQFSKSDTNSADSIYSSIIKNGQLDTKRSSNNRIDIQSVFSTSAAAPSTTQKYWSGGLGSFRNSTTQKTAVPIFDISTARGVAVGSPVAPVVADGSTAGKEVVGDSQDEEFEILDGFELNPASYYANLYLLGDYILQDNFETRTNDDIGGEIFNTSLFKSTEDYEDNIISGQLINFGA